MIFASFILFTQLANASGVAIAPDFDFAPPSTLNRESQHSDLSFLKRNLPKVYMGPKELGERLAQLHVVKAQTPAQFCAQLAQAMSPVRDQHLRVFLNFKACDQRTVVGHVGNNLAGSAVWALEQRPTDQGPIDILSIAKFPSDDDPSWRGFLDEVRGLRSRNKAFILDLRGNSGGDDAMGFEMARILFGLPAKVILPNPLREQIFLQTPEALAIQANLWLYRAAHSKARREVPAPEDQIRHDQLLAASLNPGPKFARTQLPHTPVGDSAFQPNVYVLIDHVCASACETTLQVLEGLPHRILVGERTRGAVEYGAVGMLLLPHSHIAVQLSTLRTRFWDERHPEAIGYSPEISVAEGEDALESALRSIKITSSTIH